MDTVLFVSYQPLFESNHVDAIARTVNFNYFNFQSLRVNNAVYLGSGYH